jgi:hypothetical protein
MPSRKHRYDAVRIHAPWVDALEDRCLRTIVVEAFMSRQRAAEASGSPKLIAAGDKSLEQVEFGRVHGERAWLVATSALRQFDQAWMGFSMPPGTLGG